jgi:PAS domain S-box-containing protein
MAVAGGLFQRVVDTLPDAVVLLDQDARIRLANDRAARVLGGRREDLLGRSLFEFVDGDAEGARRLLRRGSASGSPLPGKLDLITRKGPLLVSAYVAAVPAEDERLIALRWVEHRSVSRVFQALEERLDRLRSELHRERRLQSELQGALKERDTLLDEVHHRVRNNLQVISSFLNLQMSKHGPGVARDALREATLRRAGESGDDEIDAFVRRNPDGLQVRLEGIGHLARSERGLVVTDVAAALRKFDAGARRIDISLA